VEGLCRRDVLYDISFALYGGEVLGIAGLMGSGRTELARALFGIDPLDSGRFFIRGAQTIIGSPRAAIKQGMGFLTEDRKSEGLIMGLPVKENICLASVDRLSRLGLVDSQLERRAAAGYVRDLRIRTTGLQQQVMFLSGGNQQKVVLSKWLCCRADILIFDEPTRGIDVGSKVEIYQLLNRLTAEGAAVLMISSELPEIIGMSDRILVMSHGRIAGEFTAAEATQERIMECALGVPNAA
jgi:ribose transport system ATP-binding protein